MAPHVETRTHFGPQGVRLYSLELVTNIASPGESYRALCEAEGLAQELLAQARVHFDLALRRQVELEQLDIQVRSRNAEILCRAYVEE